MKKLIFVSERMSPPYDEGIRRTVFFTFQFLQKHFNVEAYCTNYDNPEISIKKVVVNLLFLNLDFLKKLRKSESEFLVYFPYKSATFASYLRFLILRMASGKKTLMIALQYHELKKWQKLLFPLVKPGKALTTSMALHRFWERNKIKNHEVLPIHGGLEKFYPLSDQKAKKDLKKKYGIDENAFVITHIGHIRNSRNLESLIPLQNGVNQVVVVGSSSTRKNLPEVDGLRAKLKDAGFKLLEGYIENIQEVYQMSDLYIFPVEFSTGAISFPLSVLEARACNTPVLSTEFGSLKLFIGDDNGTIVYSKSSEFAEKLNKIKDNIANQKVDYTKTKVLNLEDEFEEKLLKLIYHPKEYKKN